MISGAIYPGVPHFTWIFGPSSSFYDNPKSISTNYS